MARTRLALDGYGARRAGSFAGKDTAAAATPPAVTYTAGALGTYNPPARGVFQPGARGRFTPGAT